MPAAASGKGHESFVLVGVRAGFDEERSSEIQPGMFKSVQKGLDEDPGSGMLPNVVISGGCEVGVTLDFPGQFRVSSLRLPVSELFGDSVSTIRDRRSSTL